MPYVIPQQSQLHGGGGIPHLSNGEITMPTWQACHTKTVINREDLYSDIYCIYKPLHLRIHTYQSPGLTCALRRAFTHQGEHAHSVQTLSSSSDRFNHLATSETFAALNICLDALLSHCETQQTPFERSNEPTLPTGTEPALRDRFRPRESDPCRAQSGEHIGCFQKSSNKT